MLSRRRRSPIQVSVCRFQNDNSTRELERHDRPDAGCVILGSDRAGDLPGRIRIRRRYRPHRDGRARNASVLSRRRTIQIFRMARFDTHRRGRRVPSSCSRTAVGTQRVRSALVRRGGVRDDRLDLHRDRDDPRHVLAASALLRHRHCPTGGRDGDARRRRVVPASLVVTCEHARDLRSSESLGTLRG